MKGSVMPVHPARPTPFLRRTPSGRQLIVDGDAVLLLGGQLHNSSPSSPTHMRPVWEGLAATGIRSVIGNVSWAQVEPEEGSFDFGTVDAQVAEARDRNMRLVRQPPGGRRPQTPGPSGSSSPSRRTGSCSWVRG